MRIDLRCPIRLSFFAFPSHPQEARALFSNFGYTYVDVRPVLEIEEVGKFKVRQAFNVLQPLAKDSTLRT